jgi:hypothetical protein
MNDDQMRALVTATQDAVRSGWLGMITALRDANSVDAIASRLHAHDATISGATAAIGTYAAEVADAYVGAGDETARWIGQQVAAARARKKLGDFDDTASSAVAWAEQNRLDLIREITDEQRELIRGVLVDGAEAGVNPRVMAREIRDSIGLTEYQNGIVDNYRRQLESGQLSAAMERELRSGRYDAGLRAAIRNERQLTAAQIDKMVGAYRTNMIAMRAETIARTEGLRVAHQASAETYRQAVDGGDLDAQQIVRTWNHHPGAQGKYDRAFHVSMHGQTRGYDEPFVSGIGGSLMFPCDPDADARETIRCACVVTVRLRLAA